MKDKKEDQAQEVVADFSSCPEWGKGGRFVINPGTGLRERVEPVNDQAVVAEVVQLPVSKKVTTKENGNG